MWGLNGFNLALNWHLARSDGSLLRPSGSCSAPVPEWWRLLEEKQELLLHGAKGKGCLNFLDFGGFLP